MDGTNGEVTLQSIMDGVSELSNQNNEYFQEGVPPILVYTNDDDYNKKISEVKSDLEKCNFKDDDIRMIKKDRKGNILIFCSTELISKKIMSDANFLRDDKKIDLNKKPSLVFKGLNEENLNNISDELKDAGIVSWEKIGKSKFVKGFCKNEKDLFKFLNNGISLKFGHKVSVEPDLKPPTQCRKCLKFGHIERDCSDSLACKRCGGNHDQDGCNKAFKCVNCMNDHSSYSRRCPTFLSLKETKINHYLTSLNRRVGDSKEDFTNGSRVFSQSSGKKLFSFITKNDNSNNTSKIEKMLENISIDINEIKTKLIISQKTISDLELRVNKTEVAFQDAIKENNKNILDFVVGTFNKFFQANQHLKTSNGQIKNIPLDEFSNESFKYLKIQIDSHNDYKSSGKNQGLKRNTSASSTNSFKISKGNGFTTQ